jgi:hypothetical protein
MAPSWTRPDLTCIQGLAARVETSPSDRLASLRSPMMRVNTSLERRRIDPYVARDAEMPTRLQGGSRVLLSVRSPKPFGGRSTATECAAVTQTAALSGPHVTVRPSDRQTVSHTRRVLICLHKRESCGFQAVTARPGWPHRSYSLSQGLPDVFAVQIGSGIQARQDPHFVWDQPASERHTGQWRERETSLLTAPPVANLRQQPCSCCDYGLYFRASSRCKRQGSKLSGDEATHERIHQRRWGGHTFSDSCSRC